MSDASETPHINVNGLSIYSDSAEVLTAILPATIAIQINDGEPYIITTGSVISSGAYSPSSEWMSNYILVSSEYNFDIPTNSQTFTINITVTPQNGDPFSFSEDACAPIANTLTCPQRMYTGRVYTFNLQNSIAAGGMYKTVAELTWYPKIVGTYTTQVYEVGYVDSYTQVDMATDRFSAIQFAIANRDGLSGADAASLITDANIVVQTRYMSSDFNNGIVIFETTAAVPTAPRDEVDAELAPVLTESDLLIIAYPETSEINGKYVHKQATLTCVPTAQYKYGDSLSYIQYGDKKRYGGSISFQANGVTPGTEYVRPDTGDTEIATNESVSSFSISVCGAKWKLQSDVINKAYSVLWYHPPILSEFALHRCAVSSTSTEYQYDGVYYEKDDFGSYCLIEYQVDFSPLDNSNTTDMIIQYGTHRLTFTPTYSQAGFIVVPAPAAQAMDVIISLYDLLYPYGVAMKQRLSTGAILIDFLNGGTGMAVGKAATESNALDIASDWDLLFYQATVGAYSGTSSISLVPWMHDIDDRLAVLESKTIAN